MRLDSLLVLLLLLLSLPSVHAVCSTEVQDRYPGWEARFTGELGVGGRVTEDVNGTVGMKDLSVEVLQILGAEIANLRVSKRGSYEEDFSVTESTKNFDIELADIRVKVESISQSKVNLTIYTHDQAILNASMNITYETSDLNASLPGELIDLDITLENIGELEAKEFQLTEGFGDFEVVERDVSIPAAICPDSSFDISYTLRAPPGTREDTNFTLYLELSYRDYNEQLGTSMLHSKRMPFEISVRPPKLEVQKTAGNWTLLNPGREITVFNTVRNTGNVTAFDVQLVDTPPEDLLVVSGMPSLSLGRLEPGDEKTKAYTVVSDDPLYCVSSSKVSFTDELGNSYTSFSKNTGIRFSPFVSIVKTIRDRPVSENLSYGYPIKTRWSMKSNYSGIKAEAVNFTADAIMKTFRGEPYYALCQGSFLNGTKEVCIGKKGKVKDTKGEEPKVVINRSAEITVVIQNLGNTIARDVVAEERLENIEAEGETSWSGTLLPGETASYSYTARPSGGTIDLATEVSYADVDPLSLTLPEIEGHGVGMCTKKLVNVTFDSTANFTYTSPDLRIEAPEQIAVYENSVFDFLPVVYNNGTEKLYDVEISYVFNDLTLAKGQRTERMEEFGRGFKPFAEPTCNIGEWRDANITTSIKHSNIPAPVESTIVYEVKNGDVRVYVNGEPVSVKKKKCEKDGLKITHDVPIALSYPFHMPPEPVSSSSSKKKVTFKLYGNPLPLELAFLTPSVENETYIPVTTRVRYEDFYGRRYEKSFTTYVLVVPARAGFVIVRRERAELGLAINYTNATGLGEPGQLIFQLQSKGYGAIERYELNLSLPESLEVTTNDSAWKGRVEAEIKRDNETLYVLSGAISREGNISQGASVQIPLVIRGFRPGSYTIPYKVSYDGKSIEGSLVFRVRGPVISASKALSKEKVSRGEEVLVTVKVVNRGDDRAVNLLVSDRVPATVQVLSGNTSLALDALEPGEEAVLSYRVKSGSTASLGGTSLTWQDVAGNSYSKELEPLLLKVIAPSRTEAPAFTAPPSTTAPPPAAPLRGELVPEERFAGAEAFTLSSKEGLSVLALTIIVIGIVIKLITLRVPVKEEE